jgi:hypothetical protein
MIKPILTQLKTGSIKNVVQFGVDTLPAPPYVVVRRERDPGDRGFLFRVIAHFQPNQQAWLEDYIFNEVITLLDNFSGETRHGNDNEVFTTVDWTDIITNNDDGTISMERVFLVPSRTFEGV